MKRNTTVGEREEQAVKVRSGGGGYFLDYVEGRKLSRVEYGDFVLTYDPDHDERYAHITPEKRWEYPDEIRRRCFLYKREKTYDELDGEIELDLVLRLSWSSEDWRESSEDWRERFEKFTGKPLPDRVAIGYTDHLLLAKDVPVTRAWYSMFWVP